MKFLPLLAIIAKGFTVINMRVISGKYKGRKLASFEGNKVRPTSDRAKEAIFSCLQFELLGKSFYDGFCGSGAMGIEALSRGASKVIFTDRAVESCNLTKKNLSLVGESAKVINSDCVSFLKNTSDKFDIIFLDPPYSSNDGILALKITAKRNILSDDGVVILESGSAVNEVIDGLFVSKRKKYGISEFTFYKKANLSTCVFAGSFDPVTNGHVHIVKKALESFQKVIVALGVNENKKYTFDKTLKLRMLNNAFQDVKNVEIVSFDGLLVDFLKERKIINNVRGIRNQVDLSYEEEMLAINKANYPEIKNVYIFADENMKDISSSKLKELVLSGEDAYDYIPNQNYDLVVNHIKKH